MSVINSLSSIVRLNWLDGCSSFSQAQRPRLQGADSAAHTLDAALATLHPHGDMRQYMPSLNTATTITTNPRAVSSADTFCPPMAAPPL